MTGAVWVVMPAYHAERTLERTYHDLPLDALAGVLLVDDASRDGTVALARRLGIETIVHTQNRGYGGNQKTCYREALARGAGTVVMVHPDHQYNPKRIPDLLRPIAEGEADAVFGSRMLGGKFFEGGMPRWKFRANVALTAFFNFALGIYLTEIHSGFRAYTRRYLEGVAFEKNSDGFVFDTEILLQGIAAGMRFLEIPIETRYFDEASQIRFLPAVRYGLGVVGETTRFALLRRAGLAAGKYEPRREVLPGPEAPR